MDNYICQTCGTQFAQTSVEPECCPICKDERQYVGHDGQQWTTLKALQENYSNSFTPLEENLYSIKTEPSFAIGQHALLVQTDQGNVLWDCISFIDDATVQTINELGGVGAIAISHPHYYSSAVEWAHAFGAHVYLHEADRQWVMRPDPSIKFWRGDRLILQQDITLIRAGGHFEGGTVCHWASGTGGLGALLTGDVIQVVADRRWVSFMYSYPNLIPLSASKVRHIVESVEPFEFDRIYGAWRGAAVLADAGARVKRSAERYISALAGA